DGGDGDLDVLRRAAQNLAELAVIASFQQLQIVGNDLPGDAAPAVAAFELQKQAFPQIACADSGRIKTLNRLQRLFHILRGAMLGFGDLLQRGGEVAIFIKIADDDIRHIVDSIRQRGDAELGAEMIVKRDRGGKKGFERGLVYGFGCGALVTRVEVIVKKRAEI